MIAIVKYNAGNIRSVFNAVTRLGYPCVVTNNAEELIAANKVIFPGVGEASSAMKYLNNTGLAEVLVNLKQPVLGICLGLQLMCNSSEEGDVECLGIFNSAVKKFPPTNLVPQMGWNNFKTTKGDLFFGIQPREDVYFVHSYYAELCAETTAICDYIVPFSAALSKNNFYATQFHPEKSAGVGERILKNFLALPN